MTDFARDAEGLQALRTEHGTLTKAAIALGVNPTTLGRAWRRAGLPSIGKDGLTADERAAKVKTGVMIDGDRATLVEFGSVDSVKLGDAAKLIRDRGLDPDEWHVERVRVNEWGTADNMARQIRADLVRVTVPQKVVRPVALPPLDGLPAATPLAKAVATNALGVLTGCWQYPYHDETFEGLFDRFLADVKPAFGIDHGDGMDFATISRYADDPATDDPAQASIDGYGLALYRRRAVSPSTHWAILFGNHDVRMLTEALMRAERLAGIRPAAWPGEEPARPLLSIERALRTDELGVDVVAPPFGSAKYAAAEHVVTPRYIAVHGVKTDSKSAARLEVQRLGCSVSMAHTHRQRLFSVRLQRGPLEAHDATGVEVGCGMEIGGRGSLYKPRPDWANGAFTVLIGDDGEPFFEPIRYRGGVLRWRGYEWRD